MENNSILHKQKIVDNFSSSSINKNAKSLSSKVKSNNVKKNSEKLQKNVNQETSDNFSNKKFQELVVTEKIDNKKKIKKVVQINLPVKTNLKKKALLSESKNESNINVGTQKNIFSLTLNKTKRNDKSNVKNTNFQENEGIENSYDLNNSKSLKSMIKKDVNSTETNSKNIEIIDVKNDRSENSEKGNIDALIKTATKNKPKASTKKRFFGAKRRKITAKSTKNKNMSLKRKFTKMLNSAEKENITQNKKIKKGEINDKNKFDTIKNVFSNKKDADEEVLNYNFKPVEEKNGKFKIPRFTLSSCEKRNDKVDDDKRIETPNIIYLDNNLPEKNKKDTYVDVNPEMKLSMSSLYSSDVLDASDFKPKKDFTNHRIINWNVNKDLNSLLTGMQINNPKTEKKTIGLFTNTAKNTDNLNAKNTFNEKKFPNFDSDIFYNENSCNSNFLIDNNDRNFTSLYNFDSKHKNDPTKATKTSFDDKLQICNVKQNENCFSTNKEFDQQFIIENIADFLTNNNLNLLNSNSSNLNTTNKKKPIKDNIDSNTVLTDEKHKKNHQIAENQSECKNKMDNSQPENKLYLNKIEPQNNAIEINNTSVIESSQNLALNNVSKNNNKEHHQNINHKEKNKEQNYCIKEAFTPKKHKKTLKIHSKTLSLNIIKNIKNLPKNLQIIEILNHLVTNNLSVCDKEKIANLQPDFFNSHNTNKNLQINTSTVNDENNNPTKNIDSNAYNNINTQKEDDGIKTGAFLHQAKLYSTLENTVSQILENDYYSQSKKNFDLFFNEFNDQLKIKLNEIQKWKKLKDEVIEQNKINIKYNQTIYNNELKSFAASEHLRLESEVNNIKENISSYKQRIHKIVSNVNNYLTNVSEFRKNLCAKVIDSNGTNIVDPMVLLKAMCKKNN
ncbi:hypothetical protein EDEG_01304 [Edhazardia aedis USNM 41457]|uniref:Uncharacterized protein n=1 Tax=Edhazardia aedis (strain USNM 41457) TaxID=1003232 RepID=J9DA96_EDHAE|nr:hypothetical protein EDEG_01304 [Edhazardia aedis USNM 41457]|eukprot:EJW04434.1 hypothetical protein EDEG_01304 [Edhazardia aedis USNM 41457]